MSLHLPKRSAGDKGSETVVLWDTLHFFYVIWPFHRYTKEVTNKKNRKRSFKVVFTEQKRTWQGDRNHKTMRQFLPLSRQDLDQIQPL